jgi:hypothetical protein
MSDDKIPFRLAELPERAPWWPYSPWATWKRIRTGKMAAIRDGRSILVTIELLRRYLDEQVSKVQPHTVQAG